MEKMKQCLIFTGCSSTKHHRLYFTDEETDSGRWNKFLRVTLPGEWWNQDVDPSLSESSGFPQPMQSGKDCHKSELQGLGLQETAYMDSECCFLDRGQLCTLQLRLIVILLLRWHLSKILVDTLIKPSLTKRSIVHLCSNPHPSKN